jgi:hypothetical protein
MPQSIPKGLTREHVVKALADLDAGIEHPFSRSTGYELVQEGKRYSPKAVVGVAFRYLTGEILHHSKFSGGEAPGQANYELRRLGFQVIKKSQEQPEEKTGSVWSDEEVSLLVADYFDMLQMDLLGQNYNKAEHNRLLRERLTARSKSSVEFKHQNVSAVLLKLAPEEIASVDVTDGHTMDSRPSEKTVVYCDSAKTVVVLGQLPCEGHGSHLKAPSAFPDYQ